MATKLYVGNLSGQTTSDDLNELFSTKGTVTSAAVVNDRDTGMSRGFGFVEMANSGEATAAIGSINGTELHGRSLTVNEARSKERR
ncbi:MAG TPA: RNA-binding protein [Candidatus Kapabacteria bacterium]|nr:RNA-binding protein [Candidatus Kapabacteria bacterium]